MPKSKTGSDQRGKWMEMVTCEEEDDEVLDLSSKEEGVSVDNTTDSDTFLTDVIMDDMPMRGGKDSRIKSWCKMSFGLLWSLLLAAVGGSALIYAYDTFSGSDFGLAPTYPPTARTGDASVIEAGPASVHVHAPAPVRVPVPVKSNTPRGAPAFTPVKPMAVKGGPIKYEPVTGKVVFDSKKKGYWK
jgi:hypothetical protein